MKGDWWRDSAGTEALRQAGARRRGQDATGSSEQRRDGLR